jgi:hypothetical protein
MSDVLQARTAERVRHYVDAGYPDAVPVEAAVEGAGVLNDSAVADALDR